ncbi:MAG: DUF2520 domain-containing protein [Thermoanaerobaculales bacterium]|jgi:predicted short-subunit dehydrogenase-like oxidoreductase (DUF2520 family)|nr:DUF2520 domain-containing protein [Thermoanaerobaculales bacterium]
MSEPTYGLIGRGRVATHLGHYLELEGRPPARWDRGAKATPGQALAGCDPILLAISDDALEPFLASNAWLAGRTVVHFSGSLVLAGAHGLHPLMSFGPELYDHATYRSIPFVEERGGLRFADAFPRLPNPAWPLDPGLKPLYHALCVLGGNFTTLLWAKVYEDFEERLGLPRAVLGPYLEQVARNTAAAGRRALTGAIARGDRGTVARDLAALGGDPYAAVYRAFAALFEPGEVRA